jgi:XTP/dITP diphosphohydrolase
MIPLLLATGNAGKVNELAGPLATAGYSLRGLHDLGLAADAPETGHSFRENALQKALYYAARQSMAVLAEDSGLCLDALGGAPGIYSARYGAAAGAASDAARNETLRRELAAAAPPRTGRYRCALALVRTGREPLVVEGTVEGEVLAEPRGSGGFGYDPLFWYPPLKRSFAELSRDEKFAVSHRGNALRALLAALRAD